jgi:xylulokinase
MLTGEAATDVSDASGMQLMNIGERCWSEEVCEKLGIDMSMLAKLYESPEISGYITEEAARLTGLAVGTPVVAGAGDNAAAAVGMGVVRDGKAFTTIGTSGVVFAHTDKMSIDPAGRAHTFCCAVPGAWHVMGVTQAAGLSLRWLRDTVCTNEVNKADENGVDPYVIMDAEAEMSPIGANKLLFLPYLMGERTPHLDPNARGAFIGLSAIHNRGDMIRAVMEGVCYSQADSLGVLREMNTDVSEMLVCGGGGKSPLWRQMVSDALGIRLVEMKYTDSSLGTAMLTGTAMGIFESFENAVKLCNEVVSETLPNSENTPKYHELFRRYKAIQKALEPIYNGEY